MANSQTPINETNWINHPRIIEIRQVVNKIESEIKEQKLSSKKKTFEYDEPYKPVLKQIYFDKNNMAKKYIEDAGSDDSALHWCYYYDQKQQLRFVFITGGAVNGSELEHRVYFDETQKKIWEIQKYTKGPGYTFPTIWPEEDLVFDPWKAFKQD